MNQIAYRDHAILDVLPVPDDHTDDWFLGELLGHAPAFLFVRLLKPTTRRPAIRVVRVVKQLCCITRMKRNKENSSKAEAARGWCFR